MHFLSRSLIIFLHLGHLIVPIRIIPFHSNSLIFSRTSFLSSSFKQNRFRQYSEKIINSQFFLRLQFLHSIKEHIISTTNQIQLTTCITMYASIMSISHLLNPPINYNTYFSIQAKSNHQ